MNRYWSAALLVLLLACGSRSPEHDFLYGPVFVDQAGVDLIATHPLEIQGASNQILITLPANLHPDYSLDKLVDSTNSTSTEFFADVQLSTGKVFTFSAFGLPGAPSYPERVLELRPEDGARLTGKAVRIRLRSTRPAIVPEIEWQSWNEGM